MIEDVECPSCLTKTNFHWIDKNVLRCGNCGFEIKITKTDREIVDFLISKHPHVLTEYLILCKTSLKDSPTF